MTQRVGKTMGGVARAASNCGAVLIDSGIGSFIEKFAIRRGLKLIGVCPEAQITYPKLSEQNRKQNELTNGHTHIVVIGSEDGNLIYQWGQESPLKFDLAKRISIGRPKALGSVTLP